MPHSNEGGPVKKRILLALACLVLVAAAGCSFPGKHVGQPMNVPPHVKFKDNLYTSKIKLSNMDVVYKIIKLPNDQYLFEGQTQNLKFTVYEPKDTTFYLVLGKNQSIVNYLTLDSTYVTDNFVLQKQFKSPEFDAVGMSYEIKSH